MTIGEKIVKLRKQAGLSQEAFSEKLGISRQAVSKWENGTAQPTNENLAQIARLFDVTISSLLDDADINMGPNYFGSDAWQSENGALPAEEYHTDKKAFKISSIRQSGAIIVLAITSLVQSFGISSLKHEVATLRQRANEYSSLQSQIDSLESRIYSMPYHLSQNSEDFTDYHYKVINYDRKTNTATLSFSVVPKDYTRATVAEIVIKGGRQDYSVQAKLENNIYVASIDVVCDDDMSVYLYLTEDGKTRSFVLDYLSNPADDYTMRVYGLQMGGDWKIGNGKLKADAKIGCTVEYVINENIAKSSYPVKATIDFYCNDEWLYTYPCENIMSFDFVSEGKQLIDDGAVETADSEITFYEYFNLDISNNNIKSSRDIDVVITIVDNQGYEYQLKHNNFEITIPEEVTTIAPDK